MESFRIKCEYCQGQEKLFNNGVNDAKLCLNCTKKQYEDNITCNFDVNPHNLNEMIDNCISDDTSPMLCEECEEHHDLILLNDDLLCETCLQKGIGQFLVDDSNFNQLWEEHYFNNYHSSFELPSNLDDVKNDFEIEYYYKYYLNEAV